MMQVCWWVGGLVGWWVGGLVGGGLVQHVLDHYINWRIGCRA
ncbi:MAG: hypothetical protein ACPGWR_08590 [Ardenticatenaceae bacterium]